MAAPTSTNEVTARKLSSSISALWTKIKSTFQPVADRVTSIRAASSATDTKYPTEKAVRTELDKMAPGAITTEAVVANGDKLLFSDVSDSGKIKRMSGVTFDAATNNRFLSRNGTFKQVLEADVGWGGAAKRGSKAPIETFTRQNAWFGPKPSAVYAEYTTNLTADNPTWTDYGLTDTEKQKLFSGTDNSVLISAGKNTHSHQGYTGTTPTTKDLTPEMEPDQGVRVTICSRSLSTRNIDTDAWCYSFLRRILIYVSTNSSSGMKVKVERQTGTHYKANDDVWEELGVYELSGDSGWNSIPVENNFGGGWSQNSNFYSMRFTFWADSMLPTPVAFQTGCCRVMGIVALNNIMWGASGLSPEMQRSGLPCAIAYDGSVTFPANVKAPTFEGKFKTARKLAVSLSNTSTDTSFDGSANVTNIKTTGTLGVGSGGTGKTSVTAGNYVVGAGTSALVEKTPKEVGSNVLSSLDDKSNASSYADFVDNDFVVGSDHVDASTISASTFVRRTALNLWNYIKSKLSGSDVNVGGNAATAGTADTAKAFDGSFTGTNSIASALNGKSPTTHTHKTDAADVTSDDTNLGDAEDTMQFVTTDAAGYDSSHKPLYRRPALKIWNWIKSKLASDTGYINFAHSVGSATNVNSHVLAGVVFADNSLHSCMFTFVMAVTFNFRESDECGGILKVDVGIGTDGFYVKNISLSNVTGALSVGDFNLVVGVVLNRKVVGVTWNGVLKGSRYLRGTILSRYVSGNDTEFVYNNDVANGETQAWSSARQWADDSAVVHIAGSETITGAKEFSRSGQDTNFTDSSGAESIVRARTATNNNKGSCQLDAYASGGKYGLYARNSGGAGKWVANLDNDGVVNLGSSGDAVRIGGTKFVFGASQIGTDSNTFYWV